jgi:hypothetical protein
VDWEAGVPASDLSDAKALVASAGDWGRAFALKGSGRPPVKERSMPLVRVTLAEGAFTEKQKHDLAARLTDVMVAFEGS